MKLKKIKCLVLCAAVAAGMVFTGCSNEGGSSSESSSSSSESTSSSVKSSEASSESSSSSESESSSSSEESSSAGGESSSSETSDASGGNIGEVKPQKGDLIAEIQIEGFGTIKAKLFPDIAPVGVENFQKLCESGFYKGLKIHRVMADFMFQGGSLNGDGTGGEALVNGGSFGVETAENMRHFYGALCYANAGGQNSTQFYIVNNKKPGAYNSDYDYFKSMLEQCSDLISQYTAEGITEAVAYYEQYKSYYQGFVDSYEAFPENVVDIYNKDGGVPQLDGGYTVFGQVYEGFDVIDAVSAVDVADNGYGEISQPVEDIIITDITVSVYE